MMRSTLLHRQLKKLLSLLEHHSSVRLFASCCNVVFVLLFVSHSRFNDSVVVFVELDVNVNFS